MVTCPSKTTKASPSTYFIRPWRDPCAVVSAALASHRSTSRQGESDSYRFTLVRRPRMELRQVKCYLTLWRREFRCWSVKQKFSPAVKHSIIELRILQQPCDSCTCHTFQQWLLRPERHGEISHRLKHSYFLSSIC